MLFIKSFKGYEDRISEIDSEVNAWVLAQGATIQVMDVKIALAHEPGSSSGMGDLIYVVVYRADLPAPEMPPAGAVGGRPEGFEY